MWLTACLANHLPDFTLNVPPSNVFWWLLQQLSNQAHTFLLSAQEHLHSRQESVPWQKQWRLNSQQHTSGGALGALPTLYPTRQSHSALGPCSLFPRSIGSARRGQQSAGAKFVPLRSFRGCLLLAPCWLAALLADNRLPVRRGYV